MSLHGFRDDFLEQERLLAIRTLCFPFVGVNEQTITVWTRLFYRTLPGCEVTFGVIGTSVEGPSFARFFLDQITAILWTLNADFFQPGFRVTTGREVGA